MFWLSGLLHFRQYAMDLRTVVVIFFTVCAFLNPTVAGVDDQKPYALECQAWKNVTDRMMLREHLNLSCTVNPPCTGFECSGKLEITGKIEETFRFGMSLLPCTDPLKFEVVADVSDRPFNFTLLVGKSQNVSRSIPVPGGSKTFGPIAVQTNLMILLISTTSSDGLQLITIETNFTVNVTTQPPMIEHFALIPRVTVPFPYCSGPPRVFSEPLTTSQAPDLSWTGGNCTHLTMDKGCEGEKQMCTDSGRCACLRGLFWHADSKQCSDDIPTKPQSKTDAWIIVAATVSAVVIVVGITIMVVYKYRRYRERYGQHSLLADQENDTELDDPDPPMLPA